MGPIIEQRQGEGGADARHGQAIGAENMREDIVARYLGDLIESGDLIE